MTFLEKIEARTLQWREEDREWQREVEKRIERRHWQSLGWSALVAGIVAAVTVLLALAQK